MLKLVWRNLLKHPLRSLLTTGSLVVALFLLCTLRSLVTTMNQGVELAKSTRLVVQSAVSLFVGLPVPYQAKIEQIPGVEKTCKLHWFGGVYIDEKNFFGQFAVDQDKFLEIYSEVSLVEGSKEAFLANRTGCIIGKGLQRQFGWNVGDTVPITGQLYPHPSGPGNAWEFKVEGIYVPTQPNWDDRTMFFHWDYYEKTMEMVEGGSPGTVTFVVQIARDADPTTVMGEIDALFQNGPQRVQATTEADFNAQFVSMFGNIPFFVSSIGGAVLLAILLACVNTMLMAAREQTRDVGIMKALGFTDPRMFGLLITQSMVLVGLGGLSGVALAKLSEPWVAVILGAMFPGYRIATTTVVIGLFLTVALGLFAGIVPAWHAARLQPVHALRDTE